MPKKSGINKQLGRLPKFDRYYLVYISAALAIIFYAIYFTVRPNSVTRRKLITYTVPEKWHQSSKNDDYQIDYRLGPSKNPTCMISVITAMPDSDLKFDQFLKTTTEGQAMINTHNAVKLAGQDAWVAKYNFGKPPYSGDVENSRVVTKWKNIYLDVDLYYPTNLDPNAKTACQQDFQTFFASVKFL